MELSPKEVGALLGVTLTKLSNWRRPTVMKNGTDNPRHLPAHKDEEGRICYQIEDVLAFLKRPENRSYLEHVLASFLPDSTRRVIIQALRQGGKPSFGLAAPLPLEGSSAWQVQ